MPYKINKKSCKQSDGDSGSYVLSYTDKKGKKHSNCHTSKKKAQGQIAAIEGPREMDETDDMVFGGGGDPEAEGEETEGGMDEAILRDWIREKLLAEAPLTPKEMDKYGPRRYAKFLEKIKAGDPFELEASHKEKYGGGTITIPADGNDALIAALEANDMNAYKQAFKAGVQALAGDGSPVTLSAAGHLSKGGGFGGSGPRGVPASIQNELDFAEFIAENATDENPITVVLGDFTIDGVTGAQQSGSARVDGETSKADVVLTQCKGAKSCSRISLKLDTAEYWLSGDRVLADDFGPIILRLLGKEAPETRIEQDGSGKYVMMSGDSKISRIWFQIPAPLAQKAVFGGGNNVADIVAKGNFMQQPTWDEETRTLNWPAAKVYKSLSEIPAESEPVGIFRTGESGRGMSYQGTKYSGIRPVIAAKGFASGGKSAEVSMSESLIREYVREKLLAEGIGEIILPGIGPASARAWEALLQKIEPSARGKSGGGKGVEGLKGPTPGFQIYVDDAVDPEAVAKKLAAALANPGAIKDKEQNSSKAIPNITVTNHPTGFGSRTYPNDGYTLTWTDSNGAQQTLGILVRRPGKGEKKGEGGRRYESSFRANLEAVAEEIPGLTVSTNQFQDISLDCWGTNIGIETKWNTARGGSIYNLFWKGGTPLASGQTTGGVMSAKGTTLAKKDPALRGVLDHIGKDATASGVLDDWQRELNAEPAANFASRGNAGQFSADMSKDGYGITKDQYDRISKKLGHKKNIYKTTLPASSFLDYYAGHGVQYVQRRDSGIFLTAAGVDPLMLDVPLLADPDSDFLDVVVYWRESGGVFKLRLETQIVGEINESPINPADIDTDGFGGFLEFENALINLCDEELLYDEDERPVVSDSVLRSVIRQRLMEDLSRADRTEISRIFKKELEKSAAAKKMIRKEIEAYDKKTIPGMVDKAFKKNFEKELKKALGVSFFGTPGKINKFVVDEIQKEVEKILGDKATKELVVQICKDVIIKLYRELSFSYPQVIQRLKV